MRKMLTGLAVITLVATGWVLLVLLVVQHQGFNRQAFGTVGFIAQSTLTLFALSQPARRRGTTAMAVVLAAGAVWILFMGQSITGAQLSRGPVDALNPGAPHFEGYALVIGVLLMLQGVLTLFTILMQIVFFRSTSQSLA